MLGRLLEGALGCAIDWAYLLFALSVAARLREVSIPERPTFSRQTGLVALATNAVDLVVGAVFGSDSYVTWIAACAVFWTLLNRWFDVDLQAALWILIIGAVTHLLLEWVVLYAVLANG